MKVIDRILTGLHARRVREDEFRAKCPVHDGRSNDSLSIKATADRVLIHCFGGCDYQLVLAALGMSSPGELFDSTKPDPEIQRQLRIRRGLEVWCERRLIYVCQQLRDIDAQISLAAESLARYEDGRTPRDPVTEDQLWGTLANAYRSRTDLEQQFEILNQSDLRAKYELFRRFR